MFIRVVRFTDVDPERVKAMRERIEGNDGPPEGVVSTGITVVHDEDARTVVVLQHYETRENMEESAKILAAMDASDTPGTRATVDAGEVVVEMRA